MPSLTVRTSSINEPSKTKSVTLSGEELHHHQGFTNSFIRTVDGGHRAIKYTRIGGVKKEIYNEGQLYRYPGSMINPDIPFRNPFQHPLVRNTHHLRRSRKAPQCGFPHRHQGSADG